MLILQFEHSECFHQLSLVWNRPCIEMIYRYSVIVYLNKAILDFIIYSTMSSRWEVTVIIPRSDMASLLVIFKECIWELNELWLLNLLFVSSICWTVIS